MIKRMLLIMPILVFWGCSQNMTSISLDSSNELSKRLLAQKESSDKEVAKLEAEIAKLEADKEKYREDYETFDNNPILNELDETLKDEEKPSQAKDLL